MLHRALRRLIIPFGLFVQGLCGAAPRCFAVPPRGFVQTMLEASREAWADPSYGLYRWDSFPAILVMDTGDFRFQDEMFSRLAFFLEKRGFRGRLLPDSELAGKHKDPTALAGLLSAARSLDSFLWSHFGIRAGGTLLPSRPVEAAQ